MNKFIVAIVLAVVAVAHASGSTRFEKLFYEGKLSESQAKLEAMVTTDPSDEEAQFALGVVRFLRAHERFMTNLYEHSLRTDRFATPINVWRGAGVPEREGAKKEDAKAWNRPHPSPKVLTHPKLFGFIQIYLDDLEASRSHLRKVQSDKVKLTLAPARIGLDLFGTGRAFDGRMLLREPARNTGGNGRQIPGPPPPPPPPPFSPAAGFRPFLVVQPDPAVPKEAVSFQKMLICFDRADAAWLCGYCHFLSAFVEAIQSLDGKEHFDRHAHLFFSKIETPFKFLTDEDPVDIEKLPENPWQGVPLWLDAYSAMLSTFRMTVKEPLRLKKTLAHLEGMVGQSRVMWKWILEETDDDHEWIPSPKQKGVLEVPITREMVDTWLTLVDEVDEVLKGKKLLPFWRGKDKAIGFQFRRVLTEPVKDFNVIGWIQGTSAAPYLERGPLTPLADMKLIRRIDKAFGGWGFFGFAAWFN